MNCSRRNCIQKSNFAPSLPSRRSHPSRIHKNPLVPHSQRSGATSPATDVQFNAKHPDLEIPEPISSVSPPSERSFRGPAVFGRGPRLTSQAPRRPRVSDQYDINAHPHEPRATCTSLDPFTRSPSRTRHFPPADDRRLLMGPWIISRCFFYKINTLFKI